MQKAEQVGTSTEVHPKLNELIIHRVDTPLDSMSILLANMAKLAFC